MKSDKLLDILNDVKLPDDILTKLNEVHFAATDSTEDGDSVLHVLAKSSHAKNGGFHEYVHILTSAGADFNAIDKNGNPFLSYYLSGKLPYDVDQTVELLLANNDFDINQTSVTGQTFFELIYSESVYNLCDTFGTLIKRKDFNPNQKTSKHNSILLHMISENLFRFRQHIYDVIGNVKTNPNILNNNGQTALAQLLSDSQYKDMKLITSLINHQHCDINALDKDGNNYLQQAILSCQHQIPEIAALLITKGINVSHKNHAGKSVIDLIAENKANRSDYSNKRLLLDILKRHPASLFESDSSGEMILSGLLRSDDYTITSEFKTLLKLSKTHKNSTVFLKKIISDCFNDFRQNLISQKTFTSLINAIIDANIPIDVEYYFAFLTVMGEEEISKTLRKLKPELNLDEVIRHVNNLTKEGSAERSSALSKICESSLDLNCFDDAMLSCEEQYLRTKTTPGIKYDSKMFGHLFSLSGSLPINNRLIKLTGSTAADTAPFMTHLMNAYVAHCETSGENSEHLEAIRQVRNMTIKAMRHYLLSKPFGNYYPSMKSARSGLLSSMIADSKKSGVEIITGWPRHGINLIIKEDNLYRNNGGGCSTDATTELYKISKPENLTEEVFATLYKDSHQESNKTFIQRDMHALLGLIFNTTISGKFQTVGNCSLESMIIALKIKYRLFLPESIADQLFSDTVQFFEQFYLQEYLARYSNHSTLPHLLMRLIIQKLIPEGKLDLAGKLLKEHFTSEASQEIMHVEFMLKQWTLQKAGKPVEQFSMQLESLGVDLNPAMNSRLQMLDRFLKDTVTTDDLEEIKSWPSDKQKFQGYHLLHLAVMNNNAALASSLVQMFPKAVNQTNWFGEEPLCLAKSVEMIDILVKAGANTDRTDYDNALDCAVIANRVDLVTALLKHGAKPSEYTAYYAANKDPRILQTIIEYFPDTPTKTTHDYSTAVHAAARSGHSENLRTLVYYGGANPAASDVNGVTPLQLALRNKRHDTARLLIDYPGTLFNTPHRGDSVVSMTKDNEIQRMITLKKEERQADLEYFEKFKKSPPGIIEEDVDYLIVAIRTHDVRAIRGCLLAYPNIKVVNYSNLYCTAPLTEAIQNLARNQDDKYEETFEIVQMLLKTPGIDINARMASSEPILFMATSIGDVAALDLFLADPKLDPNRQDNVGYTALHDAVERGHLDCVKRLLQDKRVDSTLVNNRNETVLDLQSFKFGVRECQEEVARHQQNIRQNIHALAV